MMLKLALMPLIAATFISFQQKKIQSFLSQNTQLAPVTKRLPGTATITNIMAGQYTVAGTVTVLSDPDLGTLTVTCQVYNGWFLKEVHLYVGIVSAIPVGGIGNPRPGQFPYKKTNMPACTQICSFVIPLAGLHTEAFTIAAHCTLTGVSNETGWGQGSQINDGGSWAMCFEHVVESR